MMSINFPVEKFAENGKSIEPEVVAVLYDRMSVKQRDVFLAIASEKSAREVTGSCLWLSRQNLLVPCFSRRDCPDILPVIKHSGLSCKV